MNAVSILLKTKILQSSALTYRISYAILITQTLLARQLKYASFYYYLFILFILPITHFFINHKSIIILLRSERLSVLHGK
ncbi:hypothetical protein RhiirC2_528772 [Rhizophagus irregularis]|uniref:Uncharacterized protein n=1 Tax=Rhizophagus irregularis TaxID=588596 RepID=A0A2N1N4G7_9GLOM|nr:hypothetical protein RhiirC2_528772 [Rhizophagus irregularis]